MNARQKIQQARTALVLDQPFFGALALRLTVVEDPGCPTAWTDGRSLGYSPAFIDGLTHDELLGVVAHEVMHCANGHPWRRDGREQRRFNVAADYAINYVLEDVGFTLPKDRLRDVKFDGKSAEWIYARLPQSAAGGGGDGTGDGAGAGDSPVDGSGQAGHDKRPGAGGCDVRDAPAAGDTDGSTESDWQQAVQQAAMAAKARGTLPGSLERFAKVAAAPRVDWRSVLRRFVQQVAREDYSWSRPNVRHLARGLYLPSLRSEAVGPIAVAVDTSGSIDQITLDMFFAEINAVAGEVRPSRVHVIYCDAAVKRLDTFERDDVIEPHPIGGGGTAFGPALDVAEALEEPPVCLIYLTDLQGSHRAEPPAMPILWAATQPGAVPYGEVVSMEAA